jgi:hypothetical protein
VAGEIGQEGLAGAGGKGHGGAGLVVAEVGGNDGVGAGG